MRAEIVSLKPVAQAVALGHLNLNPHSETIPFVAMRIVFGAVESKMQHSIERLQ